MPIIMKNGRLITVPHLKSDKPVKPFISKEEATKPEEVTELEGISEETAEKSKFEDMTVKELKDFLETNEVDFPSSAKKADLVELADSVDEVESEV